MSPTNTILSIAGMLTALAVIFGAVVAVYRIARRMDENLGVDEDGRTLSERLNRVEHQLWENGGDSLADRVNDLTICAKETSAEVKIIKEVLLTMLGQPAVKVSPVKAVRKRKSA
jgi:hypothetical protein